MKMKSKFLRGLSLWVVIVLAALMFANRSTKSKPANDISYSEFKSYLKTGNIEECEIGMESITGTYIDTSGKKSSFKTVVVTDSRLVDELDMLGVKYRGKKEKNWLTALLFNFGPILLFILVWVFLIRSMQGGGKQVMGFAKSRAKLQDDKKKKKTTFDDVAGLDEVKEDLKEIIAFLKEPRKFQKLGGKIPKGVLLYGAPGTGKTLLARAVAGEAGVPFFSSSGSEFVEMFVGVGASRVRDLFNQGKKNAPCLLFVDELDAVGRRRFSGIGGGHDEREQTLNQILVEMDGFDTRQGVILIAATNRPDVLDPALLRPGRFDRHIAVPSPDIKGREAILNVHAKNVKLDKNMDLSIVARRTPGFVGSDLANIVNEAALLASRYDKEAVGMKEMEEAIDRVMAGPERKSQVISEREKKIIAYHESGHAVAASMLEGTDPVHKVSIVPRGPALGYTLQLPLEDKYLITKTELMNKMTVLLGGRTAEELFFKEVTTGAENDLRRSTEVAHRMVCEWGMSERIGPITLKEREGEAFLGMDISKGKEYSEKIAETIDAEVKKIIETCKKRAGEILTENRSKLKKLADELVERESLDGEEVDRILGIMKKKVKEKPDGGKKPSTNRKKGRK